MQPSLRLTLALAAVAAVVSVRADWDEFGGNSWRQQQALQTGNWLNNPGVGMGGMPPMGGVPPMNGLPQNPAFDYDSCAAGCTDPNYQQTCIRECGNQRLGGGLGVVGSPVVPGAGGVLPVPGGVAPMGGIAPVGAGTWNQNVGGINPALGNVPGSQNWGTVFTQNGRTLIICPASAVFPNGTRCTPGALTVATGNNVPGRRNAGERNTVGLSLATAGVIALALAL